jgi:hypothetical protein
VLEGLFPHLRCLLVTARAGRAVLGAAADATSVGEQSLEARLVRDHRELFAGRVFLMDRNFPRISPDHRDPGRAGGHLITRVKSGISLPVTEGGWLPDGSRLTYLDEPGHHRVADRRPLRRRWPPPGPPPPSAPAARPGRPARTRSASPRCAAPPRRRCASRWLPRPPASPPLAEATGQTALHTLNITGRQRCSERKQKSWPALGHTPVTKTTRTGPVKITRFQPAGTVT